jgi:hypothetical protein
MMFVELFATAGYLDPRRRRRIAERLGTIQELGNPSEEVDEEELASRSAAVWGSMVHVVVHEPEAWVIGGRMRAEQDAPQFAVRISVPGPWRMDMSEVLIAYSTRIIVEECTAAGGTAREPKVLVQVTGITEGSIGLQGTTALPRESLEAHGVHRVGGQVEPLAVRRRLEGVVHRQAAAQPGDQRVQRGDRMVGRAIRPEVAGQRRNREHGARVEREPGQQDTQARTTDRDGAAVGDNLQRFQHTDTHAPILLPRRGTGAPGRCASMSPCASSG